MSKNNLLQEINSTKIIAIIRGISFEETGPVCDALIQGGITVMEFAIDHTEKECLRNNCKKIEYISEKYKGKVYVGAGSVLNTQEAGEMNAAGAQLIVSPNVDIETIKYTVSTDMVSIPGAMSPTECVTAYHAGADFVKMFPAGELGLNYVKAVITPLRHIPFLVVGGVTPGNIRSFLDTGAKGFGINSGLLPKDALKNREYKKIAETAAHYVNLIKG